MRGLSCRCRLPGLVMLWTLLLAGQVASQRPPRIGLVLSGGGARGAAHVGVLKVLEELHVPVHCVAGTSMGSIVGGLYAAGYGPEQLERTMRRLGGRRWAELLQDNPPRHQRSFRRKQEEFSLLIDFGLGLRDGRFRLPKGLMYGQNLELELLDLTEQMHDLDSFDRLPLPFRAVAVELRTGRQVVLDRGNLAHAMRASMSLPGVFAPAVIDGVELLDGGLADNVPIDVARAMGAEVLIVVDIGTPVSAAEIESVLDVSGQMVQILTQQNVDRSLRSLGSGDLLLQPDLGAITSSDFERAAESIAIGEQAARSMATQLQRFAVDDARWQTFLAGQRRRPAMVTIASITIDNRSGMGDRLIRGRLRAEVGQPLVLDELREDLERLYGIGNFESVTYELRDAGPGQKHLVVHVVDKSWGPTYLRFDLALSSNVRGSSEFAFTSQANVREINELGAEWRSDVRLGERTGVLSEFYQPLVPSGVLFAAARGAGTSLEGASTSGLVDVRYYEAGLDLGVNLGTWGELRFGAARLWGDLDIDSAFALQGFDFDDAVLEGRLSIDLLDSARFPREGGRFVGIWTNGVRSLGADNDYERLGVGASWYTSTGRVTVGAGGSFESALRDQVPIYRTPSLGGFTRLSGSDRSSINGQHAAAVAGLLRVHVAGSPAEALGFPLYVGATIELGNAWQTREDRFEQWLVAGSAFVALDTPIGPAYFAYGYTEGGERSLYLFVGQPF